MAELSALVVGDDTHAQQTKCPDHPKPEVSWPWRLAVKHNNTRGKRMPSMLHKGSSCCPGQGEVQHVTQAPYVLSTMFVYQRKNTHMIGSRSMSGLTHSVWLWWSGSVCCRSYKGTRLKCSGSWISQDLEHKFILIRWSEACTKKRITLSNPVWKNNKIAAMPSLCSWHSREMVIDLQQLLSFFSYLRYLLNRLLHWFLGRQMVVCMLQDNWRNEELFSSVDQIRYRP